MIILLYFVIGLVIGLAYLYCLPTNNDKYRAKQESTLITIFWPIALASVLIFLVYAAIFWVMGKVLDLVDN